MPRHVVSCRALSCLALSCFAFFCLVSSRLALSYLVLSRLVLSWSGRVLSSLISSGCCLGLRMRRLVFVGLVLLFVCVLFCLPKPSPNP